MATSDPLFNYVIGHYRFENGAVNYSNNLSWMVWQPETYSTTCKYGTASLSNVTSGYYSYLYGAAIKTMTATDFAIEGWWYLTNVYGAIIDTQAEFNVSYKNGKFWVGWNSTNQVNTGATCDTNTWYHIALVKQANSLRLYVDGVMVYEYTITVQIAQLTNSFIQFSYKSYEGWWSTGYVDDLRVTVGHHRYTSNFTPTEIEWEQYGTNLNPQLISNGTTADDAAIAVDVINPSLVDDPVPVPLAEERITEQYVGCHPVDTIETGSISAKDIQVPVGGPWIKGNGVITGTVSEAVSTGTGLRRRVRLLFHDTALLCRETWSDEVTGAFSFTDLSKTAKFTLIVYDNTNTFNPASVTNVMATAAGAPPP